MLFGDHLRDVRKRLRQEDRRYSLRQVGLPTKDAPLSCEENGSVKTAVLRGQTRWMKSELSGQNRKSVTVTECPKLGA